MEDIIFKLSKIKSDKDFYKMYPTEEAFIKKHVKEFKAMYGARLKKANLGESLSAIAPQVEKFAPAAGKLIQGVQMLKDEKNQLQSANQSKGVSDLQLQASRTQPEQVKRKYVRPEDVINTGEEYFPIYGVGTNPLAKYGKNIKRKKAATGIDLSGFEKLGAGDMSERLITGVTGQDGGGMVGGSIGKTIGQLTGIPGAGLIGQIGGQLIGSALNKKPELIKEAKQATLANTKMMAFGNEMKGVQQGNASYMKNGGNIKESDMGGLQLYNGEAETLSYNRHLADDGETAMLRGPSHEDDGILMAYHGKKIEAEGGEPVVKITDEKTGNDDLVIFGNMKIPNDFATMLGDNKAGGKKFKNYIADISKTEAKQNKIMDKSATKLNSMTAITSFDKLELNSEKANITGANMKLKEAADKKTLLASLQSAMNEINGRKEYAKNGYTVAKKGIRANTKMFNFNDKFEDYTPLEESTKTQYSFAPQKENTKDWKDIAMNIGNELIPYLRPTNAMSLDPNQTAGERYALSTNQVQPVQAQQFTPTLTTPYDISFQDQINQGNSDFRGAQRLMGYNPAAQSILAAQKYQQSQGVLADQFRANQATRDQVYNQNRLDINNANLKNLELLDEQFLRQSQAASITRGQNQKALDSISSKLLQNNLENRTLQAYENEYGYRFDTRGRAINMNQLFTPNTPQVVDGKVYNIDKDGNIIPYVPKTKSKAPASARNGEILKAVKNIK